MKFEIVGQTLYRYFSQNRFFRVLLPLDAVILLAAAVLHLVSFFIDLGSFIQQILTFGFILGAFLCFSKSNYLMLTAGFGLLALRNVFLFFYILLGYREFPWSVMLSLAVYGLLTLQSYKKSLKLNLG